MKIATFFSIIFSFIIVFAACKKKEAEPQCPECWDSRAVCVDAECQCPEGSIEIDQTGMWSAGVSDSLRAITEQIYCLEAGPLAFLAEFDSVGCFRTMAVHFPADPWNFEEEWTSPFAPVVEPGLPPGANPITSMWLTVEVRPEGRFIKMENLLGSIGYVTGNACLDFAPDGEEEDFNEAIKGSMSADFEGYMVDENTIEGELILKASGSYEEEYDGRRKAITFVRTTAL